MCLPYLYGVAFTEGVTEYFPGCSNRLRLLSVLTLKYFTNMAMYLYPAGLRFMPTFGGVYSYVFLRRMARRLVASRSYVVTRSGLRRPGFYVNTADLVCSDPGFSPGCQCFYCRDYDYFS